MLEEINRQCKVHIVSLEDPIEFLHPQLQSTFSQRELGRDFFTFPDGLRAALRQAPKVIFVGEIRDRETMEIALTAGETGHLVFSTLHTISASQTIHRIIGLFAKDEERTRARAAGRLVALHHRPAAGARQERRTPVGDRVDGQQLAHARGHRHGGK